MQVYGNTALISASGNGHLETARLLLHRGAVVNKKDKVRVLAGKLGMKLNL